MKDLQKENKKQKKVLKLVQEFLNTTGKTFKHLNTDLEKELAKEMKDLGLEISR